MQDSIEHIIKDIYTLDPALKEQDTAVRAIVTAFAEEKPVVEIDQSFVRSLRAELLAVTPVAVASKPQPSPWWMVYLAPVGVMALLIIMLIPDYFDNQTVTEEVVPADAPLAAPETFNAFDAKRSAESMPADATMMQMSADMAPMDSFYIDTQAPGTEVVIGFATLLEPSFVVIHEEVGGEFGAILGVSPLLPVGSIENVSVRLSRSLGTDETLVAALYRDNGDGVFAAAKDTLVYDASGVMPFYQLFSTTPSLPE